MADDRFNDAFAIRDFSIGLSQWPGANNDLWAPLISRNSRLGRPMHLDDLFSKQAVAGFLSTPSRRELGSG